MRLFRTVTIVLFLALLLSVVLHAVLLMSDSPAYRAWVYVQMSLHLLGALLLWRVRYFNLHALAYFAVVALFGVYINAAHLNYGNGAVVWVAPTVFLTVYVGLALWVKTRLPREKAEGP